MAIWQYQIFLLPREEIDSYSGKSEFITEELFNQIDWWKYRQLNIHDFDGFQVKLPKNKSWSDNIILFGADDSNRVQVWLEQNRITEVEARLDLRENYKELAEMLCNFAAQHNCVFLNYAFKIINPNIILLEEDILSYPVYKSFLDMLNGC